MKYRTIILLFVCLAFIVSGGESFAQNSISITGDIMLSSSTMTGDEFTGISVDAAGIFGSSFTLVYERIVLGGAFLLGDFQWNYDDFDQHHSTRRQDFTFHIGYEMSRNLYLFAGAKQPRWNGTGKDFWLTDPPDVYQADYNINYDGTLWGGGLAAVMQFPGSPFFLKWSAAYYSGTLEINKSADNVTFEGYPKDHSTAITDIFVGLGYRFEAGFGIVIGYKAAFAGEKEGEERNHGVMTSFFYDIAME
ncbi:hypothetical protein JXO52_12225 [bacterium]|nr:hypothetical protein [bacterium]